MSLPGIIDLYTIMMYVELILKLKNCIVADFDSYLAIRLPAKEGNLCVLE